MKIPELLSPAGDPEKLNKAIQEVKGIGNQVLGIEVAPFYQEYRQYALFLSWILEELLALQDGLAEVE